MLKSRLGFPVKIALLAFLAGLFSCGFFFSVSPARAAETTDVSLSLVSPTDASQYFALSNPQTVAESEKYLAFVSEKEGVPTLFVFNKSEKEYTTYAHDVNTMPLDSLGKQMLVYETANADFLIFQNRFILYSLRLSGETAKSVDPVKKTESALSLTSSSFAFGKSGEKDYVAIAYENDVTLYTVASAYPNGEIRLEEKIAKPFTQGVVAMNGAGDLFYSSTQYLYADTVANFLLPDDNASHVSPVRYPLTRAVTQMAADSTRLFFLTKIDEYSANVGLLNLKSGTINETAIQNTTFSKLGELKNPVSLALCGGDLLALDAESSTVSRFSGDTLAFTGYAVATTEASFNRIPQGVTASSLSGDTLGFLSGKVVTLVRVDEDLLSSHFTTVQLPFTATELAVGETYALASDGNNLCFFLLSDPSVRRTVEEPNVVGVDYASGKFYVATTTAERDLLVYDEASLTSSPAVYKGLTGVAYGTHIAVDLDGNLAVYSFNNTTVYYYPFDGTAYGAQAGAYPVPSALRLDMDLAGNLYSLSAQNTLTKIDFTAKTTQTFSLKIPEELVNYGNVSGELKTLALNFDRQTAYFTVGGASVILGTDDVQNRSTESVLVPTLALHGAQGDTEVKKITLTTKNAFLVSVEDGKTTFTYHKKIETDEEEFLILGETEEFTLLLGSGNRMTLIKSTLRIGESPALENAGDLLGTAIYVAPKVSLYRYPVLHSDYTVVKDDKTVRFDYGDKLIVNGVLTLNDDLFYYVSGEKDGETYYGYVPSAFTRTVVSDLLKASDVSFITVKKDASLKDGAGEPIYTFTENTRVVKLEEAEGKIHVLFLNGETPVRGYVESEDLYTPTDNTLIGGILILVISLAVSVTTLYLIYRKKTYLSA